MSIAMSIMISVGEKMYTNWVSQEGFNIDYCKDVGDM